MSLLEMIIAMGLTVLVLFSLTFFYREIDMLNSDMEKTQKLAFEKLYLENRLSSILPKILPPRFSSKMKNQEITNDYFMYTAPYSESATAQTANSLIFTFKKGPDMDPDRANDALGRLYIDQGNRLCLATWPSPVRWQPNVQPSMRKEILLENVVSLDFQFYVPPEKDRKKVIEKMKKAKKTGGDKNTKAPQPVDIQPKGQWHNEWRNDYAQLPALVKVILKRAIDKTPEEISFIFQLPLSDMVILYEQ